MRHVFHPVLSSYGGSQGWFGGGGWPRWACGGRGSRPRGGTEGRSGGRVLVLLHEVENVTHHLGQLREGRAILRSAWDERKVPVCCVLVQVFRDSGRINNPTAYPADYTRGQYRFL